MPGNRETTVQLRPTVTQLCIDQIRPEISINQKCNDSSMRSDLKIMRCSNGPGGSIKPKFVADNRTQRNEHKRRVSLLFSDPFFKFSGKMTKMENIKNGDVSISAVRDFKCCALISRYLDKDKPFITRPLERLSADHSKLYKLYSSQEIF